MKLRAPAYPLITIDPNFSVWSAADRLTDTTTVHWTDKPNTIIGTATIDGNTVRIMGADLGEGIPAMKQTDVDMSAFTTKYVFEEFGVRLTLLFTSPIIPSDLYLLSRPVSYLKLSYKATDKKKHSVSAKISVSEQICLDKAGQYPAIAETTDVKGRPTATLGSFTQNVLARDGDDLRIDWGYFYLTTAEGKVGSGFCDGMTFVWAESDLDGGCLMTLAYDDIKSIQYFGDNLKAYWKKSGETIKKAIDRAHREYDAIMKRCDKFSARMKPHAALKI